MESKEFREFIDALKASVDIVDVIGSYIEVDRNGKALCTFHPDTVPSLSINKEGQYWHCFGCCKGGDVIRFIELYNKVSFKEAVCELAGIAGIEVPAEFSSYASEIEHHRKIEDILGMAADFYHENLNQKSLNYLINIRGLSRQIIDKYMIGYASGGLKEHLINECGLDMDLCVESGVLRVEDLGIIIDTFTGRIIFPNIKMGRVVYMSGRSIDSAEPRYLNLEAEISHMYNEDALSADEVFIAEGVIDCLTLIDKGYNAVAIYGAGNFKDKFIEKFLNCKVIYICLDSDEAGRNASISIAEKLQGKAKIISLPEGLDINDFFKDRSTEDFQELTNNAVDAIIFELNSIPVDTPKIELPDLLDPILKRLSKFDSAKIEAYLSYEIKSRFKLKAKDIDAYREKIKNYRNEIRDEIEELDELDNPNYIALFEGLVDIVEYDGKPAFLVKENEELKIKFSYEKDGQVYTPPPKKAMPWLLPRGKEILRLSKERKSIPLKVRNKLLYKKLLNYHKSISELPSDEYYDLLVCWDFHSYLLEKFNDSPFICLFAVPERGKSRTGRGMINVAYRGFHSESLNQAYIFRVADNFMATIFFDVMDLWGKAKSLQCEDIVLSRFEKGAIVPRVIYPERGAFMDTEYYEVFGPTIIATNEAVHKILETRAVQIIMPRTTKKFEIDVTKEMALPLKEELVLFRADYMDRDLPEINKPAEGRLGDILKPIMQIVETVYPEKKNSILKVIDQITKEKLLSKLDTLEAKILEKIIILERSASGGILSVKIITDTYNLDFPDRFKLSPEKVGKKLSSMGFKKAKTNGGNSAIVYDCQKIEMLKEEYGLSKPPEPPEPQEISYIKDSSSGGTGGSGGL